ncbi:MAG: hypothetical protein U5Q03_18415 [Bacteroidota bacterium]|nr:hypothetical protein [Bacteroidota bacterium]
MIDFDVFIKGKLEGEAKSAEKELHDALDLLPDIPDKESLELKCNGAGLDEKHLETVKEYWTVVDLKVNEISEKSAQDEIKGLDSPTSLLNLLKSLSESLQEQIIQHNLDAKEFDRQKIENEILELEAKNWTSQQKEAIREEVKRLKKVNELENLKGMANSKRRINSGR